MSRMQIWGRVLCAAWAAVATAAAQGNDDDGDGPAEGFRKRFEVEIPATPDGLDARYEGAVAARRIGDVDTAMNFYRQILKTDPQALTVHIAMGTAYWEKGELKEAEEWLNKALEINPKQIKARQFLGQLQTHSGRFADATATFDALLKLEKNLDDVVASAHLNLGRIALVKRKWSDAEKAFKEVGRSPERGDRASAERGLKLLTRLRKTAFWNREQTESLDIHFSPKVDAATDPAWRKQWAARREAATKKMYDALGWRIAEQIPVYVYKNDDDAYEISDQETTHAFRYSWWLVHTRFDSAPGRDIALQVVGRRFGARPASMPLVWGLCAHFDDTGADRHTPARKLAAAGKLRDLISLSANQRVEEGMVEFSTSFVAFAIAEYGLPRFLDSYRLYNTTMLDTQWRMPGGAFKWQSMFDKIFRAGMGVGYAELDQKWRAKLQ